MKKINSYIFLFLLIIYAILASLYLSNAYEELKATAKIFDFNIKVIILFVMLGFLMGLENLVKELLKNGRLKLNIFKIIFSIILCVLIGSYILAYAGLITNTLAQYNNIYTIIIQSLIFGYSITCIVNKEYS